VSTYNIEVPERNSIDSLAEQREQRDAAVRARMSKKSYHDAILQGVREALEEIGHPLGELADRLFDAPIRDAYDRRAFLEMRDTRRLGAALLTIVADASLVSYEEADDIGF
jgi:hypothetical protein